MKNFELLARWGWNDFFYQEWKTSNPELIPARVMEQQRSGYKLLLPDGRQEAGSPRGRLGDSPTVGDWVLLSPAHQKMWRIEQILTRQTFLSRQAAGTGMGQQAIAANLDGVLIATSANEDFSMARLERYVTLSWEAGAQPLVLITKSDLCDRLEELRFEVESRLQGVTVMAISLVPQPNLKELVPQLYCGRTYVLVGSSGVGKSSLVNALLGGNQQAVQSVRGDDGKGRHTTTARGLFLLPTGALLMDTPGLREVQIGESAEGVERAFEEILNLAEKCRFRDCRHQSEPGCAIQAALQSGQLESERWLSYQKQLAEIRFFQRKQDKGLAAQEKQKWKKIHKQLRSKQKLSKGGWEST